MQIKRTLPLAIALLSFVCFSEAYSQTRKRPNVSTPARTTMIVQKRRVILDLVAQEPIAADFIQADATSITVEINGTRRVFRMDEVVSIIFSPDEADRRLSQAVNTQGVASAREAVRVLRRLNSAIDAGVSYIQYSQLVVEVKGAVDEALASTPAGELRNEIMLAMEAYVDARQVWDIAINGVDFLQRKSWRNLLRDKYQIPDNYTTSFGSRTYPKAMSDAIVGRIFNVVRAHLDRASSLNQ